MILIRHYKNSKQCIRLTTNTKHYGSINIKHLRNLTSYTFSTYFIANLWVYLQVNYVRGFNLVENVAT